jgi:SAM-dependent methyltransferase
MPAIIKNIKSLIKEKNVSFYNEIANDYEKILEQEKSNKIVRKIVADKFQAAVKSGAVLDFGGGTGLDLEWLTNNNYNIFFCETSFGMRAKAIEYNKNILHNKNISFLKNNTTDFANWNNVLPFSEKMDAVLSDFAVINCIPDIELLFKNLALVMKPGSDLIALILQYNFKKILKSNLRGYIKSFFLQKPLTTLVKYSGKEHTVFVYSRKEIKKASKVYFNFCSYEILKDYGFSLIHLTKK